MAPRIARETKRVWSINVKREGRGGLLIARGATSTRMDPQQPLGIGHGAIGEPFPAQPASLPASPGAGGSGWGRDSEVHVQINPKQSGLEIPDSAAPLMKQARTGQHIAAPHRTARQRTRDWRHHWTRQNGASTQDTLLWTRRIWLTSSLSLSFSLSPGFLMSAVLCSLGDADSGRIGLLD